MPSWHGAQFKKTGAFTFNPRQLRRERRNFEAETSTKITPVAACSCLALRTVLISYTYKAQ
jgi:hypothetical protein